MAEPQPNSDQTTTEGLAPQVDEGADEVFRRKSSTSSQHSHKSSSPSPKRAKTSKSVSPMPARSRPHSTPAPLSPTPSLKSSSGLGPTSPSAVKTLTIMSAPSKAERSKSASSKATPRASQSSTSGSPPFDSTKPMKYTSIDLENELPDIFSSSLNPAIEDPDMSEFFSRAPPFKARSPPPVYISRKASSVSSMQARKAQSAFAEKKARMKMWLALFVFVFFVFPITVIIVFRVIPDLMSTLGSKA
ncbi:hypothetical protein Q1695_015781 [Nippostrongylus brasiliensis]|nr:hypothetical protein Q1695_015781 [Nippostrongylus brasiliensis]